MRIFWNLSKPRSHTNNHALFLVFIFFGPPTHSILYPFLHSFILPFFSIVSLFADLPLLPFYFASFFHSFATYYSLIHHSSPFFDFCVDFFFFCFDFYFFFFGFDFYARAMTSRRTRPRCVTCPCARSQSKSIKCKH